MTQQAEPALHSQTEPTRAGIWLITSGAYVGQELAAEFGRLPPSFLPVGTRRLYEYQLETIGAAQSVFLTVPDSYALPQIDAERLQALGITVLGVPEELRLGESVIFALNLIGAPDQPVRILHGDTLAGSLPVDSCLDEIGIGVGGEGYSWAEATLDGAYLVGLETVTSGRQSGRPVAIGYFAFAHSLAFVRCLTRMRGDFIAGVGSYAREHPITSVTIGSWYDFGHLQTFFRSRRVVTSARVFNTLRIDGRTARKSSEDVAKMQAEATWLTDIPPPLRIYSARLIETGQEEERAFYATEYQYLPTLSELFVYGALTEPAWIRVMQSCQEFLTACAGQRGPEPARDSLRVLVAEKTEARLHAFAETTGFDVNAEQHYAGRTTPSLMRIAAALPAYLDFTSTRRQAVMHGDFCFSNILYDSRVQRIHVIDPRGYVKTGQATIYGDLRYDMAKFAHSVNGRYDQIISGRYRLDDDERGLSLSFETAPHHAWLEQSLRELVIDGIAAGGTEIQAIVIGLFLSMLPLHSDRPDRQRAFVANALRLYGALSTPRATSAPSLELPATPVAAPSDSGFPLGPTGELLNGKGNGA